MKDFKSMVIGFLMATCMFMLMGQTSSDINNGNGKYQAYTHKDKVYMIDTSTGAMFINDGVTYYRGEVPQYYWENFNNEYSPFTYPPPRDIEKNK